MTKNKKQLSLKGYQIIGKIAKGGMGEVYKAIHKGLGKEVILKKLLSKAPKTFFERFKREASIMMEISHPNIVHIFDYIREGNSSYIAMEFVDGYSLLELLKKFGDIPVNLACYIVYNLAQALKYAHSKGIIHRDIKPGNVLISKDGEVKLTDFGIAFKRDREDESDITRTGTLLGTPAYMSPEQIHSSKSVDYRTDIYSLGTIFYEMLTGQRAFVNEFSMENVIKIKKGKYPKIRKFNKNVPPKLVKIIKKMMHCKKSKRYDSIDKFIEKMLSYITVKFKDIKSFQNKFAQVLISENSIEEIAIFQYPKRKILFSRIRKSLVVFFAFIVFMAAISFFFPSIFIRFAFPNKFGLLNVSIQNNDRLGIGKLKLLAKKTNFNYDFVINKRKNTLFSVKNKIVYSGKYTAYLFLYDKIYVSEVFVKPFNSIKRANKFEYSIPKVTPDKIKLLINVFDEKTKKQINDYKIFVKRSDKTQFEKLHVDELLNGNTYDFFIKKNGYNSSLINGVKVSTRQSVLFLTFYMDKK